MTALQRDGAEKDIMVLASKVQVGLLDGDQPLNVTIEQKMDHMVNCSRRNDARLGCRDPLAENQI